MATKRVARGTGGESAAVPHDGVSAETLGGLIDALLPVLVDRLAETGLGEIEVERDGAIIRVRAEELAPAHRGATTTAATGATASAPSGARGDERKGPSRHAVRSTAVGYLTLSKEVHVGAKVAKGALVASVDVLGIAAEVRADQGGIIAALKVATGDPVEYGQELFVLETVGEAARADAARTNAAAGGGA
jgi:acetyl-CoA carboxylase biotin carboxyl carrier protein